MRQGRVDIYYWASHYGAVWVQIKIPHRGDSNQACLFSVTNIKHK